MKLVKESLNEFINPKTDEYDLEDTIPLGPKALKKIEIEEWFAEFAPDRNYEIDKDLDIIINGDLLLFNTNVTKLPEQLEIDGNLTISNCPFLKYLPDNLTIKYSLNLNNSSITELPKKLKVWRLNIEDTEITEIPKDAKYTHLTGNDNIPSNPSGNM